MNPPRDFVNTLPRTTGPRDEIDALRRENDALTNFIEALDRRTLSEDELEWFRNAKREQENQAWAWQQIKRHAPWLGTLAALVGAALAWLVTHSVTISSKQ